MKEPPIVHPSSQNLKAVNSELSELEGRSIKAVLMEETKTIHLSKTLGVRVLMEETKTIHLSKTLGVRVLLEENELDILLVYDICIIYWSRYCII